ncbi:calcium-transporting ATPase 7, plasma membrane-type-like [Hordeum vulgare subsp. vulgare]|nr:calcium-transporting ATPase 7, plasma membrane-type-like [Hordeum vulgare subsp. vulgare]XP_044973727.1 calcium-transporting ATPase 7, plasma membrane-type-like [Hordeum vulgare subsp. vulgare]XP_044973728.1 calcium-transporting ATPase 7, plasma membrane-type-like [Hordeum vulgare subsp. vulgare]XP_044973729.1 calcium-transporting ATPase 7, plasma membrane-type-like [Hordeum vulgare subsp. vulgare]XP_044973730.1 calcium-transporting ATPase 7, plasma membrane-type-like [Hordeum vulgare subsp.
MYMPHEDEGHSHAEADADAAAVSSSIRGLVKDKCHDCFRRLGGSTGIAAKLTSHPKRGIRDEDMTLSWRKKEFGDNTCPKPRPRTFFRHVLDALGHVSVVALLASAAVSLGLGIMEHGVKDGWYDGATIFLAAFVVFGVTAVISHAQAKRDHKLATESANLVVTVVRAARRQEISVFDVVVGDVLILKTGDVVPADGVFLDGHGFQVDESSLTGHPGPIDIDAGTNPFLASGVKVVNGHGSMLVTAVGTNTTAWSILSTLKLNTRPAPLEERLESLISTIGKATVAVALVAFTVLLVRHFTNSSTGKPLLIEKGVPIAVSLMATFAMKMMVKDKALVHSLSASVTVICTDMTGMLTLNRMEVTEFWVGTARPRTPTAISSSVVGLLCQGVGLNTTGSVYKPDNVSQPEISGSPVEKALLSWATADLSMDAAALKRSCKVVHVEAFNSDEKPSPSRAIIRDKATRLLVAHWKGGAEVLLAMCSMYMDTDATVRELGVEQRNKLEKVIRDMVASGLRCLGFAYKKVDDTEQSKVHHLEELTLLGIVGLKDTCRPEVNATIEDCTKASMAVKMLTGDNILMALTIAKECGIISSNDPDGVVIEGHQFRAMSVTRQLQMVDKIRVMASSRPQDKLLLVKRLKHKGHVVAVTAGEGINDAAALKEADVVLCMDVHGTDVSTDTIFLNGKFDVVVKATRWGRCAYHNFQKFIQFHIIVNAVAIIVNFMSAVTMGNVPLTTVQIMWVNLVMGVMSTLALSTDKPTDALMESPPISRTTRLINNAMCYIMAAQAMFQIAVLLGLQFLGNDDQASATMIFNVFMLFQVFNEFNMRDNVLAGVLKNRMFLLIVALALVLQVVTVEVLTKFVGTTKLGLGQWGVCLAIATVSWPVGWAVKFIPVPVRSS